MVKTIHGFVQTFDLFYSRYKKRRQRGEEYRDDPLLTFDSIPILFLIDLYPFTFFILFLSLCILTSSTRLFPETRHYISILLRDPIKDPNCTYVTIIRQINDQIGRENEYPSLPLFFFKSYSLSMVQASFDFTKFPINHLSFNVFCECAH